ncbi:MAG: lysine--tRNA ligase [Candidatus Magasanikbacteria bacterium]|nr:lysine--tRNA ligase [Candidatus Magasanikbacteria bacterium]
MEKTIQSQPNINDEREIRLQKLHDFVESGINPYPAKTPEKIAIAEALIAAEGTQVSIAGRIMTKRDMGKLTFCHIQDATGKMQIALKKDDLPEELYTRFIKKIDAGDIIHITGERFLTHKGEPSILVATWQLLSKALRPLPDKFHGIKDDEVRLRKRYLDLLQQEELRQMFEKKALFWEVVRSFMKEKGFFEVETPFLETTTGGAEATPFATHHNDFDLDVYLRISVGELWQKRLMAAGFEKTFEIGRIFRNEGSSPDHLQEFTNMECYWAYADYEKGMALTQELYQRIANDVFHTTKFETKGHTFDLAGEWPRIDYCTEVQKQTGVNVLTATEEEMKQTLTSLGVVYEGDNRERLTDTLWKYCRKKIAGPAFLVHHPKIVSPLAKVHPTNPQLTERFQIIIAGSEVGNGFSELNDPIDQRERFMAQQALIDRGDSEAMMPDFEFVEMLEHGMPPTFGFGFGERLFAFLVNLPIRETVLFPLMRPEVEEHMPKQKKQTMVAHAVLLDTPQVPYWSKLNAAAHLAASLAAREGRKLIHIDSTKTTDGEQIPMNIQHAIMMKKTDARENLLALKHAAEAGGFMVTCFTEEMRDSSNDEKVKAKQEQCAAKDIRFLGVLVYGPLKEVSALTEQFPLAD